MDDEGHVSGEYTQAFQALAGSVPSNAVVALAGSEKDDRVDSYGRGLKMLQMVGLMTFYSNQTGVRLRLEKLQKLAPNRAVDDLQTISQTRNRHLTDDQITSLIDQYQSGVPVHDLARRFNVHRDTISRILKREGIPSRRKRAATPETERLICKLYQDGTTTMSLADEFDISISSINRLLKRNDVEVRARGRQTVT